MELTNQFKGLDLVNRVPEELWSEVCNIVQEAANKIIPKQKKCKRQRGYRRGLYKQLRKEERLKAREKGMMGRSKKTVL